MSVTVLRQIPLTASLDLYDFVITGDPSTAPGIVAAIGSRAIQTDGSSGSVQWLKYGSGAQQWERALGGGSGGGGGGPGVASVTGTNGITASPTSGAVVVSPTYGTTSNTIAQGNDARFLSTVDKTDLTDGGDTTLHTHDGRYYTEAEVDALIAAIPTSGASPTDTHAWQPVGALVGGVPESLFDSDGNHVMAYAPL